MLTILQNYWPQLLEGFKTTLLSSVLALAASTLIGAVMGIAQVRQHPVARGLATAYVEFFRNIPLLIIAMFFYVVVPRFGLPLNGFWAGTVGLAIYTSSFIADNVRAGILAVDYGQVEAGLSQGFSKMAVLRYIIMPQAVRIIVPQLGNQFINLVKNSSVLAMIAGFDLMYFGDFIAQETFATFDTYILIGVFYLLLTVPLTLLMKTLERRLTIS